MRLTEFKEIPALRGVKTRRSLNPSGFFCMTRITLKKICQGSFAIKLVKARRNDSSKKTAVGTTMNADKRGYVNKKQK